jgi:PilZ domain
MSLLQVITRFKHTFIEQRRSIREHVHFPAWIEIGEGSQRRECTILDVSESGSRLLMSSPARFPKEFWLVFSKDGTRRRRCRMVWRSNEQIGVTYLEPLQSAGHPTALN